METTERHRQHEGSRPRTRVEEESLRVKRDEEKRNVKYEGWTDVRGTRE